MTIVDKKILTSEIDKILTPFSFKRKGSSWYNHTDNDAVIKVFNIQKSYYSKLYYPNAGVYYRDLNQSNKHPYESDLHVRCRAMTNIFKCHVDIYELLDLEKNHIDNDEYRYNLKISIESVIIPQLNLFSEIDELKKLIKIEPWIQNTMILSTRVYLGI